MATESTRETLIFLSDVEPDDADPVQAALARIESGTFGLCLTCEQPIERARIDLAPLTELCAACDQRARRSTRPDA